MLTPQQKARVTQTCPQCAAVNPSENRFCTHFGFGLEAFRDEPSQQLSKVCAGCGAINEPSFAYCYRCGLALPDALHPRAQVGGSPAGFWIRFLACLIDQTCLFIISFVVAILIQVIVFTASGYNLAEVDLAHLAPDIQEKIQEMAMRVFYMAVFGLETIYYTFPVGYWGRTAGKAILGLKVTRTDGSRVSYLRAFARYWAYFVSALPLGLGFLSISLSAQKRGWHDLLCDTRVVSTRR
ncbi:MAG: RDD family protein [Chloroflexi bacterium]|nr:RDD family protein [Chloroflexota bacterium]